MKFQLHKIEKTLSKNHLLTAIMLLLACLMLSTLGSKIHEAAKAIQGKEVAR